MQPCYQNIYIFNVFLEIKEAVLQYVLIKFVADWLKAPVFSNLAKVY